MWQPQIKGKGKLNRDKDSYQVIPFNSLLFCPHNNYFVTTVSITIRLSRGVLLCLKKKLKRFITRSCKDIISNFLNTQPPIGIIIFSITACHESRQLSDYGSGGEQLAFKLSNSTRSKLGASTSALWALCWAKSFTTYTGLKTEHYLLHIQLNPEGHWHHFHLKKNCSGRFKQRSSQRALTTWLHCLGIIPQS